MTFVTAYGYLVVHELMPIAEEERWLEMALGLAVAGCIYGDAALYAAVHMNPSLRFSAWKSDDMKVEFDKLFVDMDQDHRMAEYARVQKLVVEKAYTIPLLQSVGTMVTQSNVSVPWATSGWINLAKIVKN